MLGFVEIIAGLGWDPEIRGLLTVALGMAVLGGSVWLLLVTNTGTRLGSLIALAGFFGWMFVMGIFWWIYGIGWAGSLPTWEVQDVFIDQPGLEPEGLQEAFVGNVADLPDGNCDAEDSFPPEGGVSAVSLDASSSRWALCTPRAIDVLMVYPGVERNAIMQELLNPQNDESKIPAIAIQRYDTVEATEVLELSSGLRRVCAGSTAEVPNGTVACLRTSNGGLTPATSEDVLGSLSPSQRDDVFGLLVEGRDQEIIDATTSANERLGTNDPRYLDSSELEARIEENLANANLRIDDISLSSLEALAPQVNEWAEEERLIRLAGWNLQSTSQAGEAAATADAFLREELFPEGNFVVLDAFQQGGKPKRDGSDIWTRVSHKVTSTARITHPTNYTVVNVQQSLEKPVDPSKPPPIAQIDAEEPTYSVVMTRNLGNLRLIPALFTIVSLILFLVTCLILHWRDLGLREKGLEV